MIPSSSPSFAWTNQRGLISNPTSGQLKLGTLVAVILLGIITIFSFAALKIETVAGNQLGVLETYDGVSTKVYQPGTYFWFPNGFGKRMHAQPASGQVFAMTDKTETNAVDGRPVDPLKVNTLDNQQMTFNIHVTWHRDPVQLVELYKHYNDNVEEKLLRPEIANEISRRATLQNAIDLYSGPKLNELRDTVTAELRSATGKLATSGIVVDRVVIDRPSLNKDYEDLIEKRQLAIATESMAKEQKAANLALAEAGRTAALKEQYEKVVAADTAKQVAILQQDALAQQSIIQTAANAKNVVAQQEADSQKVVLASKAEAARNVAISEAQKQAEVNRAVGIKAVGEAAADANKLLLASYSVPGSDNYTRIQVADHLAAAYQGVRYYPASMSMSVIASEFSKGLNVLAPSSGAAASVAP